MLATVIGICTVSIVGLLIVYYITSILKEFFRHSKLIRALPGPKSHPLLGHVLDLLCDDATFFKKLRNWGQVHSPVYNITASAFFPCVNISGPEDFELIASGMKHIEKATVYTFLENWLGKGLLTSAGTEWQNRRKILTPAFHFKILQQFVTIFNQETTILVNTLKRECHNQQINVVPYISQFTLCTINETSMGSNLNLENEEDKTYFSAIHRIGKIFYYRTMRPWLYFPSIYYYLSRTGVKENNLVKILHSFTNKVIRKRSENFEKFEVMTDEEDFSYAKKKKLAMLDLLLNARENGLIDNKGIQDEVNTFMFEGHDTTSMSICFTLMLLASHKDVQELLLQEINQVLDKSNHHPTYSDLQELKYMERCIKESLRLYPSVPFIARILEEDVVTSTGHILPKNSVVNIHIFDIHRNPTIWPEPDKFDPDRFLLENCHDRHPFAYVPFSAGPRNCIGQRFAILEIKAVLCGILRNFILEPIDTPDTIVLVPDIILRSQNGIVRVKFEPRI